MRPINTATAPIGALKKVSQSLNSTKKTKAACVIIKKNKTTQAQQKIFGQSLRMFFYPTHEKTPSPRALMWQTPHGQSSKSDKKTPETQFSRGRCPAPRCIFLLPAPFFF
jgi:hypothetical protein